MMVVVMLVVVVVVVETEWKECHNRQVERVSFCCTFEWEYSKVDVPVGGAVVLVVMVQEDGVSGSTVSIGLCS